MKQTKQVDYMIIGQGLAGSCVALQLLLKGKRLMVFDQPKLNKSSSVAAGLFNPVTGKVMTKTWKTDALFSCLFQFYQRAETFLSASFFYPTSLYRPFSNVMEQNEWMAQSADASLRPFIESISVKPMFGDEVNDPLGGLLLTRCGYLDVLKFIEVVRNKLLASDFYCNARFDCAALHTANGKFRYEMYEAEKIIFCGGLTDSKNDFFSWLPLKPLKGETLSINITAPLSRMYNNGIYVVPSDDRKYKVGATYNFNDFTEQVTSEGLFELESKLQALLALPYEIVQQQWGLRPCSWDRKPILGEHPAIKNMFVFNGLGTKGVSLAPYFSNQLVEFMEGEGVIDSDVDLKRIKKSYPKVVESL